MADSDVLTVKEIFSRAQAIITDEHFVYAKKVDGWYHGRDYVNKDAVYIYPTYVKLLCKSFGMHFRKSNVDVVVGPTIGAVSLAQWTADWLTYFVFREHEVMAVCADEEDVLEPRVVENFGLLKDGKFVFNAMGQVTLDFTGITNRVEHDVLTGIIFNERIGTRRVLKRGYDRIVKGKRCLIVEDIINSGATVLKTKVAIEEVGGIVVGVGALCNRSGGKVTAAILGVPELISLLDLEMKMYKEEECPICKEKGPESVRTDLGKGREFFNRKGLHLKT